MLFYPFKKEFYLPSGFICFRNLPGVDVGLDYGILGIEYANPDLIGTAGLNAMLNLEANAFIGLKGIPILGDFGYPFSWPILNYNTTPLPGRYSRHPCNIIWQGTDRMIFLQFPVFGEITGTGHPDAGLGSNYSVGWYEYLTSIVPTARILSLSSFPPLPSICTRKAVIGVPLRRSAAVSTSELFVPETVS